MGAWGPGIFSDDYAPDVKDDYLLHLMKGKTNEEATALIIKEMLPEYETSEDYPVFWIALAVTQWKKGRLLPEVKENLAGYTIFGNVSLRTAGMNGSQRSDTIAKGLGLGFPTMVIEVRGKIQGATTA